MATVVRRWGKPHPTNRPLPRGGGLGWVLPAYRRCPVAIPVSFQNFRVRVGYAATHPTHEIRHRVRLGAPSSVWRRLRGGGASPTLRTARRSAIYDRHQKNVEHQCPTYNSPLNRPLPLWGRAGVGLARIPPMPCGHTGEKDKFRRTVRRMATVVRRWGKPHSTNRPLPPVGEGWGGACPHTADVL